MESSCVPPGFRFHPTDEELVGYYLRKKVASQKIDLDVIREIDLYRIEPWDLQERCRIGYEEQNEWYFFSHKDKKYPTGTRTNRATMAGFWKATGRDKAVYDKAKLIGMRKTLVFYKGRAPNGQKTDWIMHEINKRLICMQEEGWVVCRAFKKRTTNGQTKTMEGWDSSYLYEEGSGGGGGPVVESIEQLLSRQSRHHHHHQSSFMCKQEIENMHANIAAEQFVQLPQLESPSLPLVKRPTTSTMALVSESNEDHNMLSKKVVTDWRDLDKFVASQLSHGGDSSRHETETDDAAVLPSFMDNNNHDNSDSISDMSLLQLLQSSSSNSRVNNEGNRLMMSMSPFLNTSSDCDIGICVFEN
ncbi:hypothetical protein Ahy_B05g079232 [Arachis hypogaea]|uniref:NAC domain-containing protein n=1 Tax=Arachis hypogaea TaxID=3818 RepID=A0A444Z999_ARAHY|nr:hypothetical protein Ahy_B05g079232 [Arachis hypogaea]